MAKKINVFLFFIVVLGFPMAYFVMPKADKSNSEKRKLATFPSFNSEAYLAGTWTKQVDEYIDDHFPFRTNFISSTDYFHAAKGFQLKHSERVVVLPKKQPKLQVESGDSTKNQMAFLDEFEEKYAGSMLIIDGCVYPMGGGSPAMSKYFAEMVNEYARTFNGVRVFSAVAPLSSAFIPVEKYAHYNSQNKRTLLAIKNNLKDGAIFCDVFGELNEHSNTKLYFGTDHHWKPLGAYYGYVAFCKAAGLEAVPLDKMNKKVKYNFLGTMYQHTQDPTVRAHPDTMEYWVPKVQTEAVKFGPYNTDKPSKTKVFYESSSGGNTYSTFLGGDEPLIRIQTGIKNGKKAVVIKNSMGNAFAVYLVNHYQEIWVVDLRYSKQNLTKIIKENNINDIVFAVGMYAAMSKGTIGMMRRLTTQSGIYVPPTNPEVQEPNVESTPHVDSTDME
ncbi:MAG: hypothetical protein K9I97_06015 [Cryomorphaceae bacterium]|nr:hypothetical protein [Cryomorphaceae bacterium]